MDRMVLTNFKSYAGTHTLGPFHKNFSCIVGPNGSGKSNVIDALLFVFGYRATKIRQKKLTELIHRSSSFPDLDFCSVDVHFEKVSEDPETGEVQILEGSGLVVSRKITRKGTKSGSSTYYINSVTSSFGEVTSTLKDLGIDLDHNRFLILQGEVEQISMMRPIGSKDGEEGLLEYLEDIIGTNQYISKIEEKERRLEELNEQRTSQLNLVKMAEKERSQLEGVKNEAVEFVKLKRDLLLVG